jgi:putative YphP/YqiW family bacilliredoxin
MPYPAELVQPMREELTVLDVEELMDAGQVEDFLSRDGTKLVFINSVCGCAAGQARPALRIALQHTTKPDSVATVFAGQDLDATARARAAFSDVPPSSPSAALLDADGGVAWFLPRHQFESRDAQTLAFEIVSAFDKHCA